MMICRIFLILGMMSAIVKPNLHLYDGIAECMLTFGGKVSRAHGRFRPFVECHHYERFLKPCVDDVIPAGDDVTDYIDLAPSFEFCGCFGELQAPGDDYYLHLCGVAQSLKRCFSDFSDIFALRAHVKSLKLNKISKSCRYKDNSYFSNYMTLQGQLLGPLQQLISEITSRANDVTTHATDVITRATDVISTTPAQLADISFLSCRAPDKIHKHPHHDRACLIQLHEHYQGCCDVEESKVSKKQCEGWTAECRKAKTESSKNIKCCLSVKCWGKRKFGINFTC